MKKNYVLDTNVLIHNPNCIYKFEDNDIYIPHPVIEELDRFKNESSERGYSARKAIRNIKSLREKGNLLQGIPLEDGGKIYLLIREIDLSALPVGWERDKKDNIILLLTSALQKQEPNTILVTNDANMMLKADALNLPVQEYQNDRVAPDYEVYSGRSERYVDESVIESFYNGYDDVPESDAFINLTENEFITLKSLGSQSSALCKYQGGKLLRLYNINECPHPCGIEPKNAAQRFFMEALLSPASSKPLTIANGPAGTGKTLLTLACALEMIKANRYKRILVCRANVTMDEELGYLPGTERDKIDPLLRGVYDNLGILLEEAGDSPSKVKSKMQNLFNHGIISAESVAYLRGRSICDTFVIIDEAQNCTPNQILSIVTRASKGSKFVLLGDIHQIDNTHLDYGNNGLVFAIETMKGTEECEICSFEESESTRSPLAKVAAERMTKKFK